MVDKQRFEAFLRALLGALTVGSLLVALSGFDSLLGFSLRLVVAWALGAGAASWLVYGDGWERLRTTGLFRPATKTSTATLSFVLLAFALKVGAKVAVVYAAWQPPRWAWLAESALALGVAYAAVFLTGPAGAPRPRSRSSE